MIVIIDSKWLQIEREHSGWILAADRFLYIVTYSIELYNYV